MGSFNDTCALSGLVVTPKTPVRLLFLSRNPYGESGHRRPDHHGLLFVRTPPLRGRYADSGMVDVEDSPVADLVAATFSDTVVARRGLPEFGGTGAVRTGEPVTHYFHAAFKGRLSVHDGDPDVDDPVAAVVAREDVWREFQAVPLADRDEDDGKEASLATHAFLLRLRERYATAVSFYDRHGPDGKGGRDGKSMSPADFRLVGGMMFERLFFTPTSSLGPGEHLRRAAAAGTPGDDDLLLPFAELIRVEMVLSRLRRAWFVPTLGGQTLRSPLHMRVAEITRVLAATEAMIEAESVETP